MENLKADFNFDLLEIDGTISKTIVKDLISTQLAFIKSQNIDPVTAFEWTLQVKQKGFLTFSSSSELEKLTKFIKEESELFPYIKGFVLTELKKQNK